MVNVFEHGRCRLCARFCARLFAVPDASIGLAQFDQQHRHGGSFGTNLGSTRCGPHEGPRCSDRSKSIVEAFVLANYMEENAHRQYMAMQIGKPYHFTPEEMALCREKLWSDVLFQRAWDHFHAKLAT